MEKLLFLGDLFYDYEYIADDIKVLAEWIKKNNYIVVVNAEGAIKCLGANPIKKRGPNLASSEQILEVLKMLNVKGVCLANNHTMDFGAEALDNTIRLIKENGIAYCGAGENVYEAVKPMKITMNENVYSIFNFGWDVEETVYATHCMYGCAPRIDEIVLDSVKKEIEIGNKVIACFHWGFEYNRLPMPMDIELAHKLIDLGVELVIGHHPHCIQPKEKYHGKYIYYSLGNFYFSSRRSRYKKIFPEEISNQSDFGAMIEYSEQGNKEFIIMYDHNLENSQIVSINEFPVLEDITGIDYKCMSYRKKASERKVNNNPILGINEKQNKWMLKKRFFIFTIKNVIKEVLVKMGV